MTVVDELPAHAGAIDSLLDSAFGLDRQGKTVYLLREGIAPVAGLSLVALVNGELAGTIRYWPILAAGTPALLLGPIAVDPAYRCRGIGARLIGRSLNRAAAAGHRIILLVGDAPYYQPFGFTRAATLGLTLPGPVDERRFLGLEMVAGALSGLRGPVSRNAEVSLAPLGAISRETDRRFASAA